MSFERQICPYRKECKKNRNMDCHKLERFWDCEDYDDFKLESSGKLDGKIKYVIENLSKTIKTKKVNEKEIGKCPFKSGCFLIFERVCNNRKLSNECHSFMCEDCELNIPDYGLYCETSEFEKCESYEIISTIKEGNELIGIHNTKDLKEYFGEENYEWLGGFIRCAFIEPEDIG